MNISFIERKMPFLKFWKNDCGVIFTKKTFFQKILPVRGASAPLPIPDAPHLTAAEKSTTREKKN
jgi:hypothetical protein